MSDLQEIIASNAIRAFNQGIRTEREQIIQRLLSVKEETKCDCDGCVHWRTAFDWIVQEIDNQEKA